MEVVPAVAAAFDCAFAWHPGLAAGSARPPAAESLWASYDAVLAKARYIDHHPQAGRIPGLLAFHA